MAFFLTRQRKTQGEECFSPVASSVKPKGGSTGVGGMEKEAGLQWQGNRVL